MEGDFYLLVLEVTIVLSFLSLHMHSFYQCPYLFLIPLVLSVQCVTGCNCFPFGLLHALKKITSHRYIFYSTHTEKTQVWLVRAFITARNVLTLQEREMAYDTFLSY